MLAYLRNNALAASALTVALAGTSIAVVGLPRNSVGTEQLKRGAVQTSDIGAGAVTAPKIGKSVLGASLLKSQAGLAGAAPPDDPEGDYTAMNFTTRSKSQVFAYARGTFALQCVAVSTVAVGLFIDGQPLPGSGNRSIDWHGTPSVHLDLFGATSGSIPPGKHTLTVSFDCVTSSFNTGTFGGDGALGVIAVGYQPGTAAPPVQQRQPERKVVVVRAHPRPAGGAGPHSG